MVGWLAIVGTKILVIEAKGPFIEVRLPTNLNCQN